MRELSLNLLDIAENSLAAGAKFIEIGVIICRENDWFSLSVKDDGCGMDENTVRKVCDPFTTSRTTRPVGLGIPFFKYSAESAGGRFQIKSEKGKGTFVEASYSIGHIDRMPLGDFGGVILQLITMNEKVDFRVFVKEGEQERVLDTREFKNILGEDISFQSPEIRSYLRDFIQENLVNFIGGKL